MADDQRIKLLVDMGVSKENVHEVVQELDKLEVAASKAIGRPGAGGQGLQGASYAVQDFMSVLTGGGGLAQALNSVTNNMDQLGRSMGLSVTNAAKLSLAFTGFTAALPILIPLIESFWKSMAGGEKGPEPILKAIDVAEQKIQAMRGELEKILAMRPPAEVETRKRVEAAFGARGEEIVGGLAGALAATPGRGAVMTEEQRRRIEEMRIFPGMSPEEQAAEHRRQAEARAQVQDELNQANVEAARKIVAAAPTDRGARDTLRAMIAKIPGAFPERLGTEMAFVEPEVAAQTRRQHEATQRNLDANARRIRQERAAEAAERDFMGDAERRAGHEQDAVTARQRRGMAAAARAQDASLEAQRQRSEGLRAAAVIRAEEGVELPPEDARRELERRGREQQREQLDRARELRTAEAIFQQTGVNYDATAPLEDLRRQNRELKQSMSDFVRATVELASGQVDVVQQLRNGTRFLEGQGQQLQQPAWSNGHP